MNSDDFFKKLVAMLFGIEGGYVNDPNDSGGPTNYGITQDTFNDWRKMNNRMQGNVKTDITKNEARDIYYNMFWKESGADKLEDPRDAMMLFDMAVNSGVTTAKQKFKESNNNFYTMLDNRRKFYDDCIKYKPEKSRFKEGWYNRLKDLENNANKIINEGFWRPSYYNEITPFDEGYNGSLKPVGDIPDRQNKRNKYQYLRNKAIENGLIKSDNKDSLAFPRKWEDLTQWEKEEMLRRYI